MLSLLTTLLTPDYILCIPAQPPHPLLSILCGSAQCSRISSTSHSFWPYSSQKHWHQRSCDQKQTLLRLPLLFLHLDFLCMQHSWWFCFRLLSAGCTQMLPQVPVLGIAPQEQFVFLTFWLIIDFHITGKVCSHCYFQIFLLSSLKHVSITQNCTLTKNKLCICVRTRWLPWSFPKSNLSSFNTSQPPAPKFYPSVQGSCYFSFLTHETWLLVRCSEVRTWSYCHCHASTWLSSCCCLQLSCLARAKGCFRTNSSSNLLIWCYSVLSLMAWMME